MAPALAEARGLSQQQNLLGVSSACRPTPRRSRPPVLRTAQLSTEMSDEPYHSHLCHRITSSSDAALAIPDRSYSSFDVLFDCTGAKHNDECHPAQYDWTHQPPVLKTLIAWPRLPRSSLTIRQELPPATMKSTIHTRATPSISTAHAPAST